MSKFIIHIEDGVDEVTALECVKQVVSLGRISNDDKQYCYVTTLVTQYGEVLVATELNKSSDTFYVKFKEN